LRNTILVRFVLYCIFSYKIIAVEREYSVIRYVLIRSYRQRRPRHFHTENMLLRSETNNVF